jgi:hypothetical protein
MAYTEAELSGILQGWYGGAHIRFYLFESTIYGDKGPMIDGVEEIQITLSNFNDWSWELSCTVTDNRSFNFDTGYAKAECWVCITDSPNPDDWHKFPMGLYRFQSPTGQHDNASTWQLTGVSLEALVLGDSEPRGFYVPANSDIIAQCRLILMTMRPAIPASRIDLPKEASPVTLPNATYFDPINDTEGTYKLRIINTLLNAGGYYSLYTTGEGKFTTRKIVEDIHEPSTVFYSTGDIAHYERKGLVLAPQRMVKTEPVTDDYNEEEFANRIVVISGDTNENPPIYAIVENNDPTDPLSIPNFGRIVQPEPLTLQTVASSAEAYLVGLAALARARGRYRSVSFQTSPDPRRGLKERYRMYVKLPSGQVAVAGKWRVLGWTISDEGMTHEIARIEHVASDAPWNDTSEKKFRGVWDSQDVYYRRDTVTYNGTLWMALRANKAVTPTEGLDWTDSPDEVVG